MPRRIIPGCTYLVTRRCSQRQFLLKPSAEVKQVFLYALALAAEKSGVVVHVAMVMSNHYHVVVSDPEGRLPQFAYILNKYVSKVLNVHYGRWENFWAPEQTSYVELVSAEAALDKAVYAITNPVQAGLVSRHQEWPGVCLWQPGVLVARRPKMFFRPRGPMPEEVSLTISCLPVGEGGPVNAHVLGDAIHHREQSICRTRKAQKLSWLGKNAVLRQRVNETPRSASSKRQVSPRVATKNKWLRIEALARLRDFVRDYRDAFRSWVAGSRQVVFPAGTYQMRILHRVRVATHVAAHRPVPTGPPQAN